TPDGAAPIHPEPEQTHLTAESGYPRTDVRGLRRTKARSVGAGSEESLLVRSCLRAMRSRARAAASRSASVVPRAAMISSEVVMLGVMAGSVPVGVST